MPPIATPLAPRKPYGSFYDIRIVAGIITKLSTPSTRATAKKDKSGSQGASSNKGTLTDSNNDIMPNESIILCEGFPGSTGTNFDDSWPMFSVRRANEAVTFLGGCLNSGRLLRYCNLQIFRIQAGQTSFEQNRCLA